MSIHHSITRQEALRHAHGLAHHVKVWLGQRAFNDFIGPNAGSAQRPASANGSGSAAGSTPSAPRNGS